MPYLYALADENTRTGDPIMRPVFYDYPALAGASCDQSMAFTLGRDLLVAPPPKPESPESYDVCLPSGGWYDLWTGKAVTAAKMDAIDTVRETPRLDRLPVFVRAGAIVPTQPLVQSTAETPAGPLSLDVYPGADCRGTLYLDDGHSLAFAKGHYLRQAIRCSRDGTGGLRISFEPREGDYRPWWQALSITVHGWSRPGSVTVGGKAVETRFDADAGTLRFDLPDMAGGGEVAIAVSRS